MKLGKRFFEILKDSEENMSCAANWDNYFTNIFHLGKYDELVEAIKNYFLCDIFIYKNPEGYETIITHKFSDYINYLYGWMDKDGNCNVNKINEYMSKHNTSIK